jgi:hypothetical protein
MCFFVGGNMKKTLFRVFGAVLVGILLFVGVNHFIQPNVEEGAKSVTVQVIIIDGVSETIFDETINTDALFLSQVLEEIEQNQLITVHFGGSKDDQFGRFLVGFDDYVTEDMSIGPWWGYTSDTNQDCLSAGFCSGVDMAPVYDEDVFIFTFDLNS